MLYSQRGLRSFKDTLRVICLFANTESEWALGLAEPVPGRLRGMLFRTVTIFVVVVGDSEPKNFTNSFNFVCLKTFFLPMMGRGDL